MFENKSLNRFIHLGSLLLVFLCIYTLMKLAPIWQPIFEFIIAVLIPFFIAGFITYLLHPIVEGLHGRGIPRSLAIILIYLLFFAGIGYGLYKGIPLIIYQLKDLGENIPRFMEMYKGWINELYSRTSHLPEGFHERLSQTLTGIEETVANQIENALMLLKGILSSLILFAIIPFIAFYLLKDFELVKKTFWYLTPRRWRDSGVVLLRDIDESLGNYIRGQLLVCLFIGIMATISLWVAGMSYPLLLGTIIGVTNIIPYFGPILGAGPAIIIAATISFKMVIIVTVIIFALQIIEGNLLSPLIVGKSLHMHPVMIIFALLIGEHLGGILGLILAVPLMAVVKVTLTHAKVHFSKH